MFVTNHDTERVRLAPSVPYHLFIIFIERQLTQQQLAEQHILARPGLLPRASVRDAEHPLELYVQLDRRRSSQQRSVTLFPTSARSNAIAGAGVCSGTGGSSGWLCQHRWVGGMVGFRNNVGSTAITNWVSPSSQQIAFGRGECHSAGAPAVAYSWASRIVWLCCDQQC